MLMSSPFDTSRSLSQQKSSLAGGPDSLEAPRFGSLLGSGKLARWVGGGLPDAADISDDDFRGGMGEAVLDRAGDAARTGVGDSDTLGEVANGSGGEGDSIVGCKVKGRERPERSVMRVGFSCNRYHLGSSVLAAPTSMTASHRIHILQH